MGAACAIGHCQFTPQWLNSRWSPRHDQGYVPLWNRPINHDCWVPIVHITHTPYSYSYTSLICKQGNIIKVEDIRRRTQLEFLPSSRIPFEARRLTTEALLVHYIGTQ
ncbi:hypothetical protein CLCR_11049 [Cladophialophora carrionii]|uniref:Uncharacterized protein n=1 Tax=Cladophialophora carrionii TaxID=86049 RepID=A0A1C1CZP8_9EURO|nr:hypothetical protein CLCR_11049 [Cladophialophora carrionii]